MDKLYFYTINYTVYEENLCKTEMKYLFNISPNNKHFFSKNYIEPSRSAYIKQCISIKYSAPNLEELVQQILADNLSYEKFKVCFLNLENSDIAYNERRKIEYIIGYNIIGEADVHSPKILLGAAKINNTWILGELEENNSAWKKHDIKPYSYSNALSTKVSRALVNMAAADNLSLRLVDPCCGIGTVVLEALSMGINIKGFEINPYIAENAKYNLSFFGYEDVIKNIDMHVVKEVFDSAIVDLPYGLFSRTTLEEQLAIIKTTRRLANKAIIVTFENMDVHIIANGFNIVDKCYVCKGKFTRYINICV